MRSSRPILLTVSLGLVLFLIVGGLAVKVGAGDNSFRQVVLFSEILSLVLDNYVDPVEAQKLLNSAYEAALAIGHLGDSFSALLFDAYQSKSGISVAIVSPFWIAT